MLTITDKKDCTGCFACANICPQDCISMESDPEGFWYPQIDREKCTDCGCCEEVCPILQKRQAKSRPIAYACYNNDENVRKDSSSGGIFTLLAEKAMDQGGIVFGVCFDDDFTVLHSRAEKKEELQKFRGSKYAQSHIGTTFSQAKEILDTGKKVMFTGTPCQIAGLKSYLQKDYDNLFCVDIICHGVPSPMVWQKYKQYRRSIDEAVPCSISFRHKKEGWKRFAVQFQYADSTEYVQPFTKDFYMKAFLKNVCLRPSCYACHFKSLQRESDVTLADFWGVQELMQDMDDDRGTSLIFVHSEKGKELLERIKNNMVLKEVDIIKAVAYNLSAIRSAENNPNREKFFEELDTIPFDELYLKYCAKSADS